MNRLLPCLFLLFAAPVLAAPAFDVASTGTSTGVNTVTSSHTLGGGCANSYAVVDVAWQLATPGTVSTVTYGATSLAQIIAQTDGNGDIRIEKWGVKNPPTGAQTVTATFSDTPNSATLTTRTYCGVDQTTPLGTPVSAVNSDATATVDVTSATDELVVDGVVTDATGDPIVVGADQNERSNFAQDSSNHTQGTSDEAGAATVTMSWTLNAAEYWAIVAVPLKPAVATTRRSIAPIIFQ